MESVAETDITLYVRGILSEFIKKENPMHYLDIGEVEARLRDGIMPLDVAPDGYFSEQLPREEQVNSVAGLWLIVMELQGMLMSPVYAAINTREGMAGVLGLSTKKRAA